MLFAFYSRRCCLHSTPIYKNVKFKPPISYLNSLVCSLCNLFKIYSSKLDLDLDRDLDIDLDRDLDLDLDRDLDIDLDRDLYIDLDLKLDKDLRI